MQKFWKKFAAITCMLCLTLTLALFAACGNDDGKDGTTVTYTVKVVLPDGTTSAGAGIAVGFCTDSCKNVTTDANGVATFEGEKGVNYHVQISYLSPELREDYVFTGYTSDDQECYTDKWNGTSYTIVLTAKSE